MIYVDDYGIWNLLGEMQLSESPAYLDVPNKNKKVIRFSYLIDWNEWDKGTSIKTNCLIRWHYGNNSELVGFYSKLYPKRESNIIQYDLITKSTSLHPRKLEAKLIRQGRRLYSPDAQVLSWRLKVEEFQDE